MEIILTSSEATPVALSSHSELMSLSSPERGGHQLTKLEKIIIQTLQFDISGLRLGIDEFCALSPDTSSSWDSE